mmetsp:Transcript_20690/g.14854  ORF Transcript_20690/g.14854 Transcript_20690/m.14854 type:complete len:137 (-) Transcript_20690:80-490(-)
MMMSEPGPPPKTTLKEGLDATLWDRWEYTTSSKKITLRKIIQSFEKKHNLKAHDVFMGSVPVFIEALAAINPKDDILGKPVLEVIPASKSDQDSNKDIPEPIDLTITFTDPEAKVDSEKNTILKNVPTVRLFFKKK